MYLAYLYIYVHISHNYTSGRTTERSLWWLSMFPMAYKFTMLTLYTVQVENPIGIYTYIYNKCTTSIRYHFKVFGDSSFYFIFNFWPTRHEPIHRVATAYRVVHVIFYAEMFTTFKYLHSTHTLEITMSSHSIQHTYRYTHLTKWEIVLCVVLCCVFRDGKTNRIFIFM